ncbi:MAG TPA: hypothetical protein VF627_04925, partial [Abditibacterium sp.]
KQQDTILYWETWEDGKEITVHYGILGDIGKNDSYRKNKEYRQFVKKEVALRRSEGYVEQDEDSLASITIKFEIEGWGSDNDLKKRHKIEDLMDECLGWTGLGHCDGGEIGSGGMSICCLVVEPYIALAPICQELKKHNYLEGATIILDPKEDEDDFKVLWPNNLEGAS